MQSQFDNIFTTRELMTLVSIVQVGDAAYHELMETQYAMFGHPFLTNIRGLFRTKLVQMQCEIESHDAKFPFEFVQHRFKYGHIIPELRNKNVILHIGRSSSPDELPYESKYKLELSNLNHPIFRQLTLDPDMTPPYGEAPFYGILTFGGRGQTFSVIQFPAPGYTEIARQLPLPQVVFTEETDTVSTFERKKSALKKEFLSLESTEGVL